MLLTTITPYWNRPGMLSGWIKAVKGASVPEVSHLLYFAGEKVPYWVLEEIGSAPIKPIFWSREPGQSIGAYHNLGATQADSKWIMKLDVDTVPNESFFRSLVPVLQSAGPREWFNVGMLYLSKNTTDRLAYPVSDSDYNRIILTPRLYTASNGWYPQATNFVCRRETYLNLGGCSGKFQHYGWEDYQQIYALEK